MHNRHACLRSLASIASLGLPTAFHGHQKITLSRGQEMLIRVTGR
jgi:hypothetical protein